MIVEAVKIALIADVHTTHFTIAAFLVCLSRNSVIEQNYIDRQVPDQETLFAMHFREEVA